MTHSQPGHLAFFLQTVFLAVSTADRYLGILAVEVSRGTTHKAQPKLALGNLIACQCQLHLGDNLTEHLSNIVAQNLVLLFLRGQFEVGSYCYQRSVQLVHLVCETVEFLVPK